MELLLPTNIIKAGSSLDGTIQSFSEYTNSCTDIQLTLKGTISITHSETDSHHEKEFLSITASLLSLKDDQCSFSISIPPETPPSTSSKSDLLNVNIQYRIELTTKESISHHQKDPIIHLITIEQQSCQPASSERSNHPSNYDRTTVMPVNVYETIDTCPGTVSFGFNSSRNHVLLNNYLLMTPCIRNESESMVDWWDMTIVCQVKYLSTSSKEIVFKNAFPSVQSGSDVIEPLCIFLKPNLLPTLSLPEILDISYTVEMSCTIGNVSRLVKAPFRVSISAELIEPFTDDDVNEWVQSWKRSKFRHADPSPTQRSPAHQGNTPDPDPVLVVNEYHHGSIRFQSCARFSIEFEDELHSEIDPMTGQELAHSHRNRMSGLLGILATTNNAAGLRISLAPRVPTWFDYDLKEETRTALPDETEEYIGRLTLGPGRYNVALFGNTLSSPTLYHITARYIQGLSRKDPVRFLSYWVPCIQNHIPENAWVSGYDLDGEPLYTARAYYKEGLHIGKAGRHLKTAMIPWGGREIAFDGEYEVLMPIPGSRWVKVLSDGGLPPNAIPGGHESDGRLIYVSRAAVKPTLPLIGNSWLGSITPTLDSRESVCPGKCAPHMRGCNVAFGGNEMNAITPFEVLVFDDPPPFSAGSA